jgi:hypothetical protein
MSSENKELAKGFLSGGDTNRKSIPFKPSTLDTVDLAMYDWLDKKLDLHSTTNKGWVKSPVVWFSQERSHSVKNDRDLRDRTGRFILPVIILERTQVTKDPSKKGVFWGNIPGADGAQGGSIEISRAINQEKTSNFANSDSFLRVGQTNARGQKTGKIVYETLTIPMPVYATMVYEIELKTEYQQQMNELLQPFMTVNGGINRVVVNRDGHYFEAFIQPDFSFDNNGKALNDEQRVFSTTMTIEVLGRLVGQGPNGKQPEVAVRQNIVEVKFPRERVMIGDFDEDSGKKIF